MAENCSHIWLCRQHAFGEHLCRIRHPKRWMLPRLLGLHALVPILLLVERAHSILRFALILIEFLQSLPALALDRVLNLITAWRPPTIECLGPHIQSVRVGKDVDRDLVAVGVQRLFDFEAPEEAGNGEKRPLLGETLTGTNSPSPTKGHVPFVVRERPVQRVFWEEALRTKSVGLRKLALVMVNSPDIALHPGILRDEVTLRTVSQDTLIR